MIDSCLLIFLLALSFPAFEIAWLRTDCQACRGKQGEMHLYRLCGEYRTRWQLSLPLLALAGPFLFVFLNSNAQEPPVRKHSNIERLSLPRLKAVHDDVQKLQALRITIPPLPDL